MTTTLTILSFFGGVMLILYGMRIAGEGLQKATGAKLRGFLLTATSNRLKSVGVGAAITALLQSSSATTVMLVGFVGAGLMGLGETMGVILGADIGTTLTVQIIAFRIYDWAIALIGVGALMRFIGGRGPARDIGLAILGFGFVFFALKVLVEAFEPLAASPLVRDALVGIGGDPVAAIILSTLVTALLQSSAATLGIAITAAHSGLLPIEAAVPIVLGANVGTCVSAILVSLGSPVDARRVAFAHVLFKVAGVLILLPFIGVFADLVSASTADPTRQVANAHTFFNIGLAVLFLPFTGPFTRLVTLLMPDGEGEGKFGPKYLDPLVLTSPSLALAQASREALRSADTVSEMLRKSIVVFEKNDMALLERVEEMDDDIDLLDREVKLYLARLSREGLSSEQASRELEVLLFSNNMENIGDVVDKNLMELAKKKIRDGLSFSRVGMDEIRTLHSRLLENFELGVATFAGSDPDLARKLIHQKEKFTEVERELRQAHINRLHMGLKESIDTSAIHLDVLTNFKRINSFITNIAYPVLEKEKS